jgi:hypothetical protein
MSVGTVRQNPVKEDSNNNRSHALRAINSKCMS